MTRKSPAAKAVPMPALLALRQCRPCSHQLDVPLACLGLRPRPCRGVVTGRIVAAGCLGEQECVVRASADVFEDGCPGVGKTLSFGYT